MENYVEFYGVPSLTADLLSGLAARASLEEECHGSFTCFESRNGVVCVPPDNSRAAGRVLRRIALELGAKVRSDGTLFDSGDHNTMFAENVPAPEDEVGSIYLKFKIEDMEDEYAQEIVDYCRAKHLDCSAESDGYVIFLNELSGMNLFIERPKDGGKAVITGDLDVSLLGAGLYLYGFRIAEELASQLCGRITFASDELLTYPVDRDFEKLRQLFYTAARQQLAFAEVDDNDGVQAYVGWNVDTFEPLEIPGSIITPFGRLNIKRLKEEVRLYGLEAVVDYRLLLRNHPAATRCGELIRIGTTFLWNDVVPDRIKNRLQLMLPKFQGENAIMRYFFEALRTDHCSPVPKDAYSKLLVYANPTFARSESEDMACHPEYIAHYPVGYLNDTVKFGFGSYLRNFKLPGKFVIFEPVFGRYIVFDGFGDDFDSSKEPERINIRVVIDYGPREEIDSAFLRPEYDWSQRDIGAGADCRVGIMNDSGLYSILAAIRIRDEVYYFDCTTDSDELRDNFMNSLAECRAVDEVDNLVPFDPTDKPRAWGATFFVSGEGSKPSFEQALEQVKPILSDFAKPITTLVPTRRATTDISSKLGGSPYCPPGTVLPTYKGKLFEFICQLNFAEINPDGKIEGLPKSGLIEFWTRDFDELFKTPTTFLRARHPDLRVRWYPEPKGGYVTEQNGVALLPKDDKMLPTLIDPDYSLIMERLHSQMGGVVDDYNDELHALFVCQKNHIGGDPELGNANLMMLGSGASAALDKDRLFLQIEVPRFQGRLLFLIPEDALKELDFTRICLLAYCGQERHKPTIGDVLHDICNEEPTCERLKRIKTTYPGLTFGEALREDDPKLYPVKEFYEEFDLPDFDASGDNSENFDIIDYNFGDDYGIEPDRDNVESEKEVNDNYEREIHDLRDYLLHAAGFDPADIKRLINKINMIDGPDDQDDSPINDDDKADDSDNSDKNGEK